VETSVGSWITAISLLIVLELYPLWTMLLLDVTICEPDSSISIRLAPRITSYELPLKQLYTFNIKCKLLILQQIKGRVRDEALNLI
jgi:hypothetical protein